MAGIERFTNLADAIRAGYQIESTTPLGYLVRTRTAAGWARAYVEVAS